VKSERRIMSSVYAQNSVKSLGSLMRDANLSGSEPQSAHGGQNSGGSDQILRLLVISSQGELQSLLREWLESAGWQVLNAKNYDEAMAILTGQNIAVVLCDCPLPYGRWHDFFRMTASQAVPPNLVVASQAADCRLWVEVLSAGGYDLLAQPLERREGLRVIKAAAQDWRVRRDSKENGAMSE
jgi:DNA-binding NtrC family response regulator